MKPLSEESRVPTIKEVSNRANVSASTVSRVLNGTVPVAEATRQRVLDAIAELNYRPNAFARSLATNRSGGVGVSVNDLASPYYGAMVQGVEAEIDAAGMHLLVASGHVDARKERASLEFLLERRSDALIVHLESMSDPEILGFMETMSHEVPLVLLGRYLADAEDRCVWLDNEAGGALATRHLLANGHTRIAHLSGPLWFPDARARLQGYRHALEEAGLAYDERYVVEADFLEKGGYLATQRLLARHVPFTAIFSGNDQMGAGAIQALRESGFSVPGDISLIGFDDVLFARYLTPTLTTVRQPLAEMGRAAARIALDALDALDGKETEVPHKFEPALVVRESVRRLVRLPPE
ncbi:MAG: LacI family DNA-binding transcriptional regulator [Jiangellaceae bacterium]